MHIRIIWRMEYYSMLNALWTGMILAGIVYAALTGQMAQITTAALDASKEAVTLCVTMTGIMSFWMGLMRIATEAGIIQKVSDKIKPLIQFLFPGIPKGHPANEFITTNMVANFLGLGWAATPAGLKAMEEMAKIEKGKKGVASDEMCTFLVLNISSLQLIPVNIIAYRSQYGSVNPTAVVGPGILATAVSTLVAVVFCKVMCQRQSRSR